MKHLIEKEHKALELQNNGDFVKAADLFKQIVDEYPDYEFGFCFYSLAYCLEELGEHEEAKKYYIKSIEYDDADPIRLGGYASFLYMHGDSRDAFNKHFELLNLEKKLGLDVTSTIIALKSLGIKIGLTEDQVFAKIGSLPE
jgi:tetratricopeptide (TPR) repeat protein